MKIKLGTLGIAPLILLITFYSKGQDVFRSDFIGLTIPQHYSGQFEYYDSSTRQLVVKENSEVKHDHTLLASFPNIVSSVTVYQVDKDGGLKIFGAGISASDATL